jgi:hypothetical protein
MRNRRKKVDLITGNTGKWVEGERVADGSVVVMKSGNADGAKGPCCGVTPPTTWKARAR